MAQTKEWEAGREGTRPRIHSSQCLHLPITLCRREHLSRQPRAKSQPKRHWGPKEKFNGEKENWPEFSAAPDTPRVRICKWLKEGQRKGTKWPTARLSPQFMHVKTDCWPDRFRGITAPPKTHHPNEADWELWARLFWVDVEDRVPDYHFWPFVAPTSSTQSSANCFLHNRFITPQCQHFEDRVSSTRKSRHCSKWPKQEIVGRHRGPKKRHTKSHEKLAPGLQLPPFSNNWVGSTELAFVGIGRKRERGAFEECQQKTTNFSKSVIIDGGESAPIPHRRSKPQRA